MLRQQRDSDRGLAEVHRVMCGVMDQWNDALEYVLAKRADCRRFLQHEWIRFSDLTVISATADETAAKDECDTVWHELLRLCVRMKAHPLLATSTHLHPTLLGAEGKKKEDSELT